MQQQAGGSGGEEQRRRLMAWGFVALQAILLIAIVLAPRDVSWIPPAAVRVLGAALVGAGVLLGSWAAVRLGRGLTPLPIPNGATELVSVGPYRWVRHPMYTAVMVLVLGIAIRSGSLLVAAEVAALVLLFNVKARWEEQQLLAAFPGYDGYAASTPRFLPSIIR